ncbi:MAG: archaeal proteasome endopeptidase complex subunit beta [Candidatus Aenigmatarchaeota archaeon]
MRQETEKYGTTTCGLIAKNCLVLAAETKATMGNLVISKEDKKIYQIDDKIAIATAGSVGDLQQLIRILKAEINLYKLEREVTVNAAATLLSNILQSSRIFPFMVGLILGGFDSTGFRLFGIDAIGGITEDKYISTGSGSPIVYGILEKDYKEDLTKNDAINLLVQAIRAARERDVYSGGKKINIAVITEKGIEFSSME